MLLFEDTFSAGSPSNLSFIFLWLEIFAKVVISSQNSAFQSFYSTFYCLLVVTPKAEGGAQLPTKLSLFIGNALKHMMGK